MQRMKPTRHGVGRGQCSLHVLGMYTASTAFWLFQLLCPPLVVQHVIYLQPGWLQHSIRGSVVCPPVASTAVDLRSTAFKEFAGVLSVHAYGYTWLFAVSTPSTVDSITYAAQAVCSA
jgi:hypothetical protein